MSIGEIFSFLLSPENLVMIVAGVAVFATVVTLASPLMGSDKFDKRLKYVATQREELRRRNREAIKGEAGRGLRTESKGFMRDVVMRLNLAKLLEDPKLNDKLMQAGLRGKKPAETFYFFRFSLPIIFFCGVLAYLLFVNDYGLSMTLKLAAAMFGCFIGYYAPGLYLANLAQKRRESIVAAFPDALDLMLICVEAGMSIEAAFHKVAGEIGTASIELAEELSLTTAELSYLQERQKAYENLAKRTNHPGVKAVATALTQAERYGTPLGSALRVMAKENRDLRLSAAEKKAAALPAQLTVPMIVFFLPVLFVVILGPAIIRFQQMSG